MPTRCVAVCLLVTRLLDCDCEFETATQRVARARANELVRAANSKDAPAGLFAVLSVFRHSRHAALLRCHRAGGRLGRCAEPKRTCRQRNSSQRFKSALVVDVCERWSLKHEKRPRCACRRQEGRARIATTSTTLNNGRSKTWYFISLHFIFFLLLLMCISHAPPRFCLSLSRANKFFCSWRSNRRSTAARRK